MRMSLRRAWMILYVERYERAYGVREPCSLFLGERRTTTLQQRQPGCRTPHCVYDLEKPGLWARLWEGRFRQMRWDANDGVDYGGGQADTQRRADAALQVEMLRIDAYRGESGEHAAAGSADRRSQQAF